MSRTSTPTGRAAPGRPFGRLVVVSSLAAALLLAACGGFEDPEESEQSRALTAAVEQWRKLVEKYFKRQHVTWALNIIRCESGGNPNAYNASSGASGLFQHLKRYWPARAAGVGFGGKSPFHPEANIAASAALLYAGGPGHWSCKYSPFENPGYTSKYFNNGVPVQQCKPHCEGDVMVDAKCGKGDCSQYGSRCVNDALGLRCVVKACPARGDKLVCLDSHRVAACHEGQLADPARKNCKISESYCSSAGASEARCVSTFCVDGPKQAPVAHDTCLPDGRAARCTAAGQLKDVHACPGGQACVFDGTLGRCEGDAPSAPAAEPEPEPEPDTPAEPEPEPEPDTTEAAAGNAGAIAGAADLLPDAGPDVEAVVGCAVPPGGAAPAWPALATLVGLCGVSARRCRRRRRRR